MVTPKLIRDGKVAILVSHDFGAGWYTWHYDERLLFEPKIVEMLENDTDPHEIVSYCEKTYGDEIYYGGVDGLAVHWLPIGTQFKIDEYDGAETLIISHEVHWITA
jgi:hypothetical protein